MPVVVAGADQEDVYVQVGPRVSISGRLVIETPQDRAALEIRASTLGIVAESGDAIGSGARATAPITGSLLDFRMGGLLSGNYVLRMFGGTGFIKSITLGGREYAGLPNRVAGDLSGVVVTVTSRTATLTGAVTEPDGSAASHAAVICFPTDAARWRGYGPSPDRLHGVPARNGRYEISLPGGEYFLIAVDAGLTDIWKDPAFLATAATRATRATVAWGDTTTRDLTRQEVEP
jgi:hypothetical protein